MPIVVRTDVREMSEAVFKEAAYAVTAAAFDIHNRFGNQFCERALYQEAITHFLGGKDRVIRSIPVMVDGQVLTTQPAHTLDLHTVFKITGTSDSDFMEDVLRRFLHHTELTAIQWVNLDKHDVTFVTLLDLE